MSPPGDSAMHGAVAPVSVRFASAKSCLVNDDVSLDIWNFHLDLWNSHLRYLKLSPISETAAFGSENLQIVNERASIRSYNCVIVEALFFILEPLFRFLETLFLILETLFLILEVVFPNVEANAVVRKAARARSGARSVHTEAIRVIRGEPVTRSLA
jgi:hypothetical protein